MLHRTIALAFALGVLPFATTALGAQRPRDRRHPAPRAAAPRLRPRRLAQPQREVALRLRSRQPRRDRWMVGRIAARGARDPRSVLLGLRRSPASRTAPTSAGMRAPSPSRRRGRGSASSSSSAPPTGAPAPGSTDTKLGEHQGGYTPFSFELTRAAPRRQPLSALPSASTTRRIAFKLEGKQGYGKARGMWQTVYLEARGSDPLEFVHYTPRADSGRRRRRRAPPRPRTARPHAHARLHQSPRHPRRLGAHRPWRLARRISTSPFRQRIVGRWTIRSSTR